VCAFGAANEEVAKPAASVAATAIVAMRLVEMVMVISDVALRPMA
jgi:hypothetical protein